MYVHIVSLQMLHQRECGSISRQNQYGIDQQNDHCGIHDSDILLLRSVGRRTAGGVIDVLQRLGPSGCE